MRRFPSICLLLALALTTGTAHAHWFRRNAGSSPLRRIARNLVAAPDGKIRDDLPLTRDPEIPILTQRQMLQLHEAILTAECTKCVVFSGPGVLTALLEVGIEAANARARALMSDTEGGLLPMVEEAADPNAPAAEGDGAAAPANTEAPTPETAEP